ncbi:endonuclease domain-containing protein [Aeromonas media]|uniref:endonuclease domain-containing protein n=1 Tax=Aeromonas media TaxID=651 RepID=UPI0038D06FF4
MQEKTDKTIWRRIGLILCLLPICFFFPYLLILVGLFAWSIYEDLASPQPKSVPPSPIWSDVTSEQSNWLALFCNVCESPAEEKFLITMVEAFDLKPYQGKLISPQLTLEMQVKVANYRFDFLANGRQVIEVDSATYHCSPDQVERDRIRDEFSRRNGYKVLRIPASIVFHTPDEAVRRVKAVIVETPVYTTPIPAKPEENKKTFTQHINAFSEGLVSMNHYVDIMSQKQSITADLKFAISIESNGLEILSQMVIREIEIEKRLKTLSIDAQKEFSNNLESMGINLQDYDSLREAFKWKKIIKPSPVENIDLQSLIEKEYEDDMNERDQRLLKIKERGQKDIAFAQKLCNKLKITSYPETDVIKLVPPTVYAQHYLVPQKKSTSRFDLGKILVATCNNIDTINKLSANTTLSNGANMLTAQQNEAPSYSPKVQESLQCQNTRPPIKHENEEKEFKRLIREIAPLGFTTSAQVSAYIMKNKLGYKYKSISGIIEMELNGRTWSFDGAFPPKIYSRLCSELGLDNQNSLAKPKKFTSFNDMEDSGNS